MKTVMIALFFVVSSGCSSRSLLVGDDEVADLATAVDLARAVDLIGADFASTPDLTRSPIGAACTLPAFPTQEGLASGSCGEGLLCVGEHLNAPGGYCTKPCDPYATESGCDETSYCAQGAIFLCLKRCTSSKDCRTGYRCTSSEYGLDEVSTCQVE